MNDTAYKTMHNEGGVPIKAWTAGVVFDPKAESQLRNVAMLPFVHHHVAVMPDAHAGAGATVGSVIATAGAVIPAAVGVDIGCGMIAARTSLTASQLPDGLSGLRLAIEAAVPVGRGAWPVPPSGPSESWAAMAPGYAAIVAKAPSVDRGATVEQLGTLGGGNHFIELCLDEEDRVWVMLHSGSRGVGNRIGSHFIELARREMERWFIHLPDKDLAYLPEGSEHFDDYVEAVSWAQRYASENRRLMMAAVVSALRASGALPDFDARVEAVDCHHNYVAREHHFGKSVLVTRKGAVRAGKGELGIIPGSMGAKSFIVRGLGHPESFESSSHGAGRIMSRTEAKKRFTVEDHAAATAGIECRKDAEVIDETPGAYKPIDDVMRAQRDLVEIAHTLRQVVCVKG